MQYFFPLWVQVNWKQGKTESFVVLRGRGALEERVKIENAGNVIPLSNIPSSTSLRVVTDYAHLGSVINCKGSAGHDCPRRVSSAMASYVPLAGKIFGTRHIDCEIRMRLFMSLVVSRLIYGAQCWTGITRSIYTKLNSVYMRGLRRIAGRVCVDA